MDQITYCEWLEGLSLPAIKQEAFQSKGAGGQKRNRVYSGVRLCLNEFAATSCEHREVQRNLKIALDKLQKNIALECFRSWTSFPINQSTWSRFKPGKISLDNSLYNLFFAMSLHWIFINKGHYKELAEGLKWSSSALIRQWSKDKLLWTEIQKIRHNFHLHPLKP